MWRSSWRLPIATRRPRLMMARRGPRGAGARGPRESPRAGSLPDGARPAGADPLLPLAPLGPRGITHPRHSGTAGGGSQQANQHLDGGRLPRPVGTEESGQLPGRDLQVQVLHRRQAAVALGQKAGGKHRAQSSGGPSATGPRMVGRRGRPRIQSELRPPVGQALQVLRRYSVVALKVDPYLRRPNSIMEPEVQEGELGTLVSSPEFARIVDRFQATTGLRLQVFDLEAHPLTPIEDYPRYCRLLQERKACPLYYDGEFLKRGEEMMGVCKSGVGHFVAPVRDEKEAQIGAVLGPAVKFAPNSVEGISELAFQLQNFSCEP